MEKGHLKQNGVHLTEHEYQTVKLLLEMGNDIELIPPSNIKEVRMPDIMMDGIPWEIKSPTGSGKKTVQNTLQRAAGQSCNIILDLSRIGIEEKEVIKECQNYLKKSKRIKKIKIIKKSLEIIDISK